MNVCSTELVVATLCVDNNEHACETSYRRANMFACVCVCVSVCVCVWQQAWVDALQVKSLRDKLSLLLDKSSTDDRLITTLQNELQNLQRVRKSAKHDADIDTMLQQMESLKRKYAEQVEQVARQEQVIAAMQAMSPRPTDSR